MTRFGDEQGGKKDIKIFILENWENDAIKKRI